MPQISRQLGTTSENLRVFVNDATVSTGAGLANIVASSVSFSWSRDDMSAVSTGTCTTGTAGTYTVSSFVQLSSTGMLGWYEFDVPNGAFLSGRKVAIHLYGAPSMAPVPILVELTKTDNQTYMSSQTVSTALNLIANADKAGYGVSSVNTGVNVTSVVGTALVTSSPGIINVSTQTIDKAGYGVSSVNTGVNVTSIVGTAAVTTQAGIFATVFDLGRTANPNSTVAFSSLSISSQSVSVGAVNVTSVNGSAIVTTAAGVIATTWDLSRTANLTSTVALTGLSVAAVTSVVSGVTVTTNNDKTGYNTTDWVSTFPEQYRTVNATATPIQALYEVLANITDMSNSATTRTLNSVTSHTALTITYGYDSSVPSSIKRTA